MCSRRKGRTSTNSSSFLARSGVGSIIMISSATVISRISSNKTRSPLGITSRLHGITSRLLGITNRLHGIIVHLGVSRMSYHLLIRIVLIVSLLFNISRNIRSSYINPYRSCLGCRLSIINSCSRSLLLRKLVISLRNLVSNQISLIISFNNAMISEKPYKEKIFLMILICRYQQVLKMRLYRLYNKLNIRTLKIKNLTIYSKLEIINQNKI